MKYKIILIHGNGGGTGQDNWQPYVKAELEKKGFEVLSPDFPDAKLARKSEWLPFMNTLGIDEDTVLIGHSSGAIAAMKYAETHKILGSVLVGGYYTDLGYEDEKASGWFDDEWDWNTIKNNQSWIIQFSSTDDPYIPKEESRFINQKLNTEYHESTDEGHFGQDTGKTEFPKLVEVIISKLQSTP